MLIDFGPTLSLLGNGDLGGDILSGFEFEDSIDLNRAILFFGIFCFGINHEIPHDF